MRSAVALLFAVSVSAAPVPKALQQKSDAELLDGRWECVSLDGGAGLRPEKRFMYIKDGKMDMTDDPPPTANGPFTLDTSKEPRQLDVKWKGWDVAQRYIYKLEGDTLTLCHAQDNQPRPSEFKGGGGAYCFVFKRVKE